MFMEKKYGYNVKTSFENNDRLSLIKMNRLFLKIAELDSKDRTSLFVVPLLGSCGPNTSQGRLF